MEMKHRVLISNVQKATFNEWRLAEAVRLSRNSFDRYQCHDYDDK